MKTRKKSIWHILKPFLTFGISILIGFISKKNPNLAVPLEAAAEVAKEVLNNLEEQEIQRDTTIISSKKNE